MRRRRGADAHDARRHTGSRHAHDPRARRQAMQHSTFFVRQQQRAGAVVHATGVARCHGAVGAHDRLEPGQCLEAGFARVLVGGHDHRVALLLRNRHGGDFRVEIPRLLRRHRLVLAGKRHLVLRLTRDLVVGGHVLGGLGHRVDAVFLFHETVDEAPADRRVVHRVGAAEGGIHLRHHERRAAHAFHAAGDHQAGLAGADRPGGRPQRIQPGATQAVDRGTRHFQRQAGQQAGHTRHVAVVFAGLVGAAEDDVGDGLPVDARVARHQGLER